MERHREGRELESRQEYTRAELSEETVDRDPIRQFARWFEDAGRIESTEANAMTLATADGEGRPSARTVLLKGFDEHGFVFYTNYESAKARQLEANPRAAMVFFWSSAQRQVRITGRVRRVSPKTSNAYFRSRPRGSRLGAWASPQSAPIPSRQKLEGFLDEARERFGDGEIPCPDHWGGFRLEPDEIEFWQGRRNRLHDRLVFRRAEGEAGWQMERLAP